MRAHVVVCGSDGLATRVVEELRTLDEEVVAVVPDDGCRLARFARDQRIETVVGDRREEAVLAAAGAVDARAIAVLEDDDVGNLHCALAVQELNADADLVVRMFNVGLGASFEKLFPGTRFMSASVLAAPAFADAALHGESGQRLMVRGHPLEVCREPDANGRAIAPLADGLVLADAHPERIESVLDAARRRARGNRRRALAAVLDRRLAVLVGVLALLVVLSATVFSAFYHLAVGDALYFTVTTVSTTGYGDINLLDASFPLKVYGMALMLLGALLLAVLYALVTDAIVGTRLARELGQPPRPERDHVVVCGLGTVGFRIVEHLVRRGVACVAVDRDDERFGAAARQLGVPVVVADAASPATLATLRASQARAVLAVTDDDVANLEVAVASRALDPDKRVVVRLFDPDLADRVQRALQINISRSVATLAAPAFVAALFEHQQVLAIVPVGRRAMVIAAVAVDAGSPLAGLSVEEVERRFGGRVLEAAGAWRPRPDARVGAGELVVLAERRGVAELAQAAG